MVTAIIRTPKRKKRKQSNILIKTRNTDSGVAGSSAELLHAYIQCSINVQGMGLEREYLF